MIGTTVGHYQILSKLGSGGMGVVYEAEDLDLRRRVALKFLPDSLAQDPAALDRFLLEARSASALNHPNICTIYAVERVDDLHFIAMELLEGDTLDRRILHQPLSVEAILDICIQVADALDTAHHRGIIHRDIKPGNIFITTTGRAKVVDFGLAKVTKSSLAQTIGAGGATAAFATSPGSTVGTVAYMSPEQARGEDLDPRSDLFSFGAVMYQMSSGSVPFEGNTSAVIFNGILEKDPPPLLDRNPALPPKLSEIVDRALEKDRDMRFQTAAEIRAELKRLKRDTTSSKSSIAAATSSVRSSAALNPVSSSSAILISEAKRHKTPLLIGAGVLGLILIAAGFGVYSALRPKSEPTTSSKEITIKRLTSGTKRMGGISISPDGKYIAHSQSEKGKYSIRLFQVATGSSVSLLSDTEDVATATSFSRDGNFVYFLRGKRNASSLALYSIPTLGGEPRKIFDSVYTVATPSPDDKYLGFIRLTNKESVSELVVTDREGGNLRVITSLKNDKNWFAEGPTWSPDGQYLAAPRMTLEGGLGGHVVIYSLKDNTSRVLGDKKWPSLYRVLWLHDGSGLVVSASPSFSDGKSQLWLVGYPDGKVSRITNDLNRYGTGSIGLSQDDKSLATIQQTNEADYWVVDGKAVRQITSDRASASWTEILPGGDMIISAPESAGYAIWRIDSAGNKRQLTRGMETAWFSVDAAGQKVAFLGLQDGKPGVWIMNADGTGLRELSRDQVEDFVGISPDASFVIFGKWVDGKVNLYRMDAQGGPSVRITPGQARAPIISPDGKYFMAAYYDESQETWRKAIFPITGGAPTRVFDLPQTVYLYGARWSADGKSVVYADNREGIGNLWVRPFAGDLSQPLRAAPPVLGTAAGDSAAAAANKIFAGPARQLTDFKDQQINFFAPGSRPGHFALSRGTSRSDLVLIQDFR